MPFNPKYTITDKILNNLSNIASTREVIERASLFPKLEAKLRVTVQLLKELRRRAGLNLPYRIVGTLPRAELLRRQ